MKKKIAVLPGDGIGPEVINEAVKVLKAIAKRFGHSFVFEEGLIGAIAIQKTGLPLPEETLKLCMNSDAVLLGAVGSLEYDNDPNLKIRPEQGLLKLRKELGLYANLRPVKCYPELQHLSPLKSEFIKGVDILFLRELTGGIYFGEKGRKRDNNYAYDICSYSRDEISRITKLAFEFSQKRRKKICLVDKANVLETSRLWREVVREIASRHPDIEIEYMFVDNASMKLIQNPRQFDVILTENMFGDILTDEASVITGSLGMLPSASIGSEGVSLYEPIHGSYPQARGKNIANPIGTILSAAMMLEISFGMDVEAEVIRKSVSELLHSGKGTVDIGAGAVIGTSELGDIVSEFEYLQDIYI